MPDRKLEAVIWDMDGVIVDSGLAHYRSWRVAFRKRGVDFREDTFQRYFGRRNDSIIRENLGRPVSDQELEEFINEKETGFRRRIARSVRAFPGALELLRGLGAAGIKTAVASSAPPENIALVLRRLVIKDCFDAIVYGSEVTEGKPSPQGFLLAARKLGVPPDNCMVMEDAVAGVAAAKRAGMLCVAVTNTHPADRLGEADLVVASLEAVDVAALQRLFTGQPD
ncbi:MAG: HAD family phosphatase [Chloroflexota bacterium]